MLALEHLRVLVRRHLREARREGHPLLQRRLASHALALAQLAEKIARRSRQSSAPAAGPAGLAKRNPPGFLPATLPDAIEVAMAPVPL